MSKLLDIHSAIHDKLQYFHTVQKIPNIIFHGPSGSGKRTLLYSFLSKIYDHDKEKLKTYCMVIQCTFGKGIKFIREELKFFAKTQIHSQGGELFKTVVLLNADKLTIDAQSALRRCIELFSHTTRFFVVIEDKYKLLKPILSRFCEIYVPEPIVNGQRIHLLQHQLENTFEFRKEESVEFNKTLFKKIDGWMDSYCKKINETHKTHKTQKGISFEQARSLVEKGYCGLDVLSYFSRLDNRSLEICFLFQKIKSEIRNETLLIWMILQMMMPFCKNEKIQDLSSIFD
jgi:replication-associated recombination protein RarA